MPVEDDTKAQGPAKDRQIRVFISSTFRDMQAERDYLVKFIFPQLRKLCESRGVTWGEVDCQFVQTAEPELTLSINRPGTLKPGLDGSCKAIRPCSLSSVAFISQSTNFLFCDFISATTAFPS